MGLLTVHVPVCNNVIVQSCVAEAMTVIDSNESCFSDAIDTARYTAVAVGPGLGQSKESEGALLGLIENSTVPLVLDADALNILSRNKEWLCRLPQGSVLTPHPGEFERLFGKFPSRYHSITSVRALARDYGIVIVLKGAYTTVIAPDGNLYFNTTGNPGMATGGSGDVLAGMIGGLLAQGMEAYEAAKLGVYLHGSAGDAAAEKKSTYSMTATDILDGIAEVTRL